MPEAISRWNFYLTNKPKYAMKRLLPILLLACILLQGCKEEPKKEQAVETATVDTALTNQTVLKIIPIEHATLVLEWNGITVYIDPVGGPEAFEGQKQADLILITDIHGDHLSIETLEALNTEKATIIAPQAVADKMPEKFSSQIAVLHNGDSQESSGITVEAIPMYNLREEALQFHTKGRGNGYVAVDIGIRV